MGSRFRTGPINTTPRNCAYEIRTGPLWSGETGDGFKVYLPLAAFVSGLTLRKQSCSCVRRPVRSGNIFMKKQKARGQTGSLLFCFRFWHRYRIVAARYKRIAPQNAVHCHPSAPQRTVALDGLNGIAGAGRGKPAARGKAHRNMFLIKADQPQKNGFHGTNRAFFRWLRIAAATSCILTLQVRLRATNTMSYPGLTSSAMVRYASRITRRARLR